MHLKLKGEGIENASDPFIYTCRTGRESVWDRMAPIIELKRRADSPEQPSQQGFRAYYKQFSIQTEQQNLTTFDPRLQEFLQPSDFFYLQDLTDDLKEFVQANDIAHGNLTVQTLHTSAMIIVNELNEPMLLGDLAIKLRGFVPKNEKYLHNSALRVVNRCEEDTHCDRNADAHVKASLFGSPSVSLVVRDGQLILGQWQRIALVEFDGPRKREVLAQLLGI